MEDLDLSSNHPVKPLFAEWVAGIIVGVGVGTGQIILFVATDQMGALVGVASGVQFAPALAIAVRIWSRSSWLFEMMYLLVWYIGPLNGATALYFIGTTTARINKSTPLVFID